MGISRGRSGYNQNMNKSYEKGIFNGFGLLRRPFAGTRHSQRTSGKKRAAAAIFLLFSLFLFVVVFPALTNNSSYFSGISSFKAFLKSLTQRPPRLWDQENPTKTCPRNYPTSHTPRLNPNITCPSYFSWIHEDLKHWKNTGITKNMVKMAKRSAHFRLVIVDGKAYVERFRKSIQTRDMFSIWGILQLLRHYPGRLPDLEIMFDCGDRPVVKVTEFQGRNARPPPLFRYCSDSSSLDIVFPDWSFWGWAECNIKPWKDLLAEIRKGNGRRRWKDRVPYAYWKGNPYVSPTRQDLLKCNVSHLNDWNTRLYIQNWEDEIKQGFKKSNLQDQCTHRYKIYAEGWAWSVSEKYILACDSMTLYIRSRYHDFYIRGMEPLRHYWPIRDDSKCTSLKYAVEWGNNYTHKAEGIGAAASKFIQEDMKMELIYDYMFHLLNEYGKLFKYKPEVPAAGAAVFELCPETVACPVNGTWKDFMEESLVKSPSETSPCNLPPYDPQTASQLLERKASSTRQVEMWEHDYWLNQNNNP